MRTEHLIRAMAADTGRARFPAAALAVGLVLVALVSGGYFLLQVGIRPDLGEALTRWNVVLKQAFPFVLAAGGLGLVLRLGRPGAAPGPWPWLLAAVPAALAAAMLLELARLPQEAWGMAVRGKSQGYCLTFIPLISTPIALAALAILRHAAPVRPGLCGAVAGLMSAGAGAAMYALFCTDDNPLFFGTSYVAGILLVTLASGLIGSRVLRW
jgi:hypothetical protein